MKCYVGVATASERMVLKKKEEKNVNNVDLEYCELLCFKKFCSLST